VITLEDDAEDDLSQVENIIRFLNRSSKHGKTIREIEKVGETLVCTIYSIVGSDDEVVIKVPKKLAGSDSCAFMDIINQTQLT